MQPFFLPGARAEAQDFSHGMTSTDQPHLNMDVRCTNTNSPFDKDERERKICLTNPSTCEDPKYALLEFVSAILDSEAH